MNGREIELDLLVGRTVRDVDGQVVGRLEELCAEVALDEGSEYVVREFHVGRYGVFGRLGEGRFTRHLLRKIQRAIGYRRYVVPWELMDLSDPERPRVRDRVSRLTSQ
jgi:sporulation protein YlmC with PRC-barrel domain